MPATNLAGAPNARIYSELSRLDTEGILWVLGEILEPSHYGPFGKDYVEDERFERFHYELAALVREYRVSFPLLLRAAQLIDQAA